MAKVDLDLTKFKRDLQEAAKVMAEGAIRGMHDVLDEWVADSVDLAPLHKSTLRKGIKKEKIEQDGLNMTGEINAVAVEVDRRRGKWAGKRFNYAYYLHEIASKKGAKPKTPGTELRFIEAALEKKDDQWLQKIEKEIADELKEKGW